MNVVHNVVHQHVVYRLPVSRARVSGIIVWKAPGELLEAWISIYIATLYCVVCVILYICAPGILHTRLNGCPVVAGLHVPADYLVPVAGGPSSLPLQPSSTPLTLP